MTFYQILVCFLSTYSLFYFIKVIMFEEDHKHSPKYKAYSADRTVSTEYSSMTNLFSSPEVSRFKYNSKQDCESWMTKKDRKVQLIQARPASHTGSPVKLIHNYTNWKDLSTNNNSNYIKTKSVVNLSLEDFPSPTISRKPMTEVQFKSCKRIHPCLSIDSHSQNKNLSSPSKNIQQNLLLQAYCYKMSQSIILSKKESEQQDKKQKISKKIKNKVSDYFTNEDVRQSKIINTVVLKQKKQYFNDRICHIQNKHFHRIRFLGKGKFGKVYLVAHKITGFVCAMKIISKEQLRKENAENLIVRQLKIHNNIKSSNVINFYGFFDDGDSFYFLMEYATGGCLLELLKNRNRLQQHELKPIVKGITQGVKRIHKLGYVHRDIKPENIILQFNIPKICDFGWASNFDEFKLCQSYCGTPLYLAPQVIKKQKYGQSVDLWGIGHLTYQLLVGKVAFSVWSQQQLIKILNMDLKFPSYIDRSQQCQDFIRKCLEKQQKYRIDIDHLIAHKFLKDCQQKQMQYQFYQECSKLLNQS